MIEDVFRNLTRSKLYDGRETQIHHELIGALNSKAFNDMVNRTSGVISSQGNIFTLQSATVFRNLLTRRNFSSDVPGRVVECMDDGKVRYDLF